jgi:hypothetical protein
MKKQIFSKRVPTIERFNVPPENGDFLKVFQAAMKEKIMLMECGEYNPKEFKKIVRNKFKRDVKYFNLKVKPLLLSCKISPKFYLEVQETAKIVFGDYVAMDELIIFLLDYFVENYGKENYIRGVPLFTRKYSGNNYSRVKRFNSKFSQFYKNHVVSFKN